MFYAGRSTQCSCFLYPTLAFVFLATLVQCWFAFVSWYSMENWYGACFSTCICALALVPSWNLLFKVHISYMPRSPEILITSATCLTLSSAWWYKQILAIKFWLKITKHIQYSKMREKHTCSCIQYILSVSHVHEWEVIHTLHFFFPAVHILSHTGLLSCHKISFTRTRACTVFGNFTAEQWKWNLNCEYTEIWLLKY